MKQGIRASLLVKVIALLLAVLCGVGGFLGDIYCLYYSDTLLWDNGSYASSARWHNARNEAWSTLIAAVRTYDSVRRGETLGYLDEKNYNELLGALRPTATNFRFVVRDDQTGDVLLSSSGEDSLTGVSEVLSYQLKTKGRRIDYNYCEYSSETDTTTFYDWDREPIGEMPGDVDYLTDQPTYYYALEYGVDDALAVEDEFFAVANSYEDGGVSMETVYWAAGLTVAFLLLTVFLMCCAGRRRGAEEFTLNWADRVIPYDLFACAYGICLVMLVGLCVEVISRNDIFYRGEAVSELAIFLCVALSAGAVLSTEAFLMSTAARFKCGVLWKNTLIGKCCVWTWRLCGRVWRALKGAARHIVDELTENLPLAVRVIGLGGVYLIVNACLACWLFRAYSGGFYLLLLLLWNGFALLFVYRWTIQWQKLREGAAAIVGGEPNVRIDTEKMRFFPDLRAHGDTLNDLGSAINTAVEERLKSERMKGELITNVSHDLKTPLTSIINYVDLLKKEEIQNEKAREYIEVLDRKSQRLKKLTEDLVEASKASTGTLTVNAERLGMVQLTEQALGEYSEKLAAARLTVVSALPAQELYVQADGRHLWRVLDNVLGNCAKYALPDTRVYLDLTEWDGNVIFTLKNISANQLNIPAEELMERFVRGDESRTTEGSGLGLSIARSLTELQGGRFVIAVDGDLFKVSIFLPKAA